MGQSSIKYYFKEYSTTEIKPEIEITDIYNIVVNKASGINDYGELKSLYTENYAESSETKVYIAPEVSRKVPDVKFNLYFIGDDFQTDYDNFINFISNRKLEYRDTLRGKRCYLILSKEVQNKSEDILNYIEAEFTFLSFKEPENI